MISPSKSFIIAIKIVVPMFCIVVLYVGIAKSYTRILFNTLKKDKYVYVYEWYDSLKLDNAIYIRDISDSSLLREYYSYKKQKIDSPISLDIKYVPIFKAVSIVKYIGVDSSFIEFIDVDTTCWGYIHGFLYFEATHFFLPPDSVRDELFKFRELYYYHPGVYKGLSDYGFYCDC